MKENKEKQISSQSLYQFRKEKKARRKKRLITFAILEILTLIMIFSYTFFLKKYSKIQRYTYEASNVKNNDISVENVKKMKGYWNIAIFGVDSRNSSVGKGNNSDVIMIASINRATGDIKLVSVYRDTYLDTGNGKFAKINNAYAVGGPEQAVKALNKNLDLNIVDYVTFNWKAVATTINLLGGVDIDITKAELREINGYITETVKGTGIGSKQLNKTGMHHLDGIQAVAYARLRHMDSDFERTARQRRILQQIFEKSKRADSRLLFGVLDEVLPMLATNLTLQDGLDAISNVKKYKLVETKGFPDKKADANMGSKGSNVIPKTLESNVSQLHTFLFGNEDYVVSNTVKRIDERIMADSNNVYRKKIKEANIDDKKQHKESSSKADLTQEEIEEEILDEQVEGKTKKSNIKQSEAKKQKESHMNESESLNNLQEDTKMSTESKKEETTEATQRGPHLDKSTKASIEGPTSKETIVEEGPVADEHSDGQSSHSDNKDIESAPNKPNVSNEP